MAEFGQPARTAVSDANAGFVNPPAKREVARTQQSQSVRATSDVDAAAKNLGSSLGNSLQKLLSEKADNINAQRTLSASMRQGEEKAVNAVDLEKKRSGWSESLFGQNIEYRAAQQQAVVNNIQQTYLEQANKISEFAADTPEQYKAKLSTALDTQLKVHEGDPETRDLIIQNWSKSASKLVAAQHKEHVGFAAGQRRGRAQDHVRGIFDTFTTESKNVSTPDEAAEFVKSGQDFFAMKSKVFDDMDPVAARSVVNEEIEYSLSEGNIGAYNMAKAAGWFDKYNDKEKAGLDTALNKYTIKAIHGINLSVSETRLAIGGLTGPNAGEQLVEILKQGEAAMEAHEGRTTGSDKFKLGISKAREALQGMGQEGVKKAADEQAEAEQAQLDVDAQNLSAYGVGSERLTDMNKPRAKTAAATRLRELVGGVVGKEDLTMDEAIGEIFKDPINVGGKAALMWGDTEHDSGMLKAMGQSYINGFDSSVMVDENQQPTEAARNALQVFAQFQDADSAKFRKQLGENAYEEYTFITKGQSVGKTSDMIRRDIETYRDSKGKYAATDWKGVLEGTDLSKREYVAQQAKHITGQAPVGRVVGEYVHEYGIGLDLSLGDHDAARSYLYDHIQNKKVVYNGQTIHGAESINKQLKSHTLPQLLNGIQQGNANDMVGLLEAGMGRTDDENGIPIRTIFDKALQNSVTFDMAPDGGLWMDSSKFQSPVYISVDRLQTFERAMIERENTQAMNDAIKQQTNVKELIRMQHVDSQFNR